MNKHRRSSFGRVFLAFITIVIALSAVGCSSKKPLAQAKHKIDELRELFSGEKPLIQAEPVTKSSFLLNTVVTITLYDTTDASIIDQAFALCEEYEYKISRTIEESQISIMNNRAPEETVFDLEADMEDLLARSLYYSQISQGAFEMTIAPLSSLWDFTGENPSVPSEEEIQKRLSAVDYHNIVIERGQIKFLSPDTKIDLGAIAKGWIADRLKSFLLEKGVESAVINLGGNVLCVGKKPDGSPFKIGVQKPFEKRNETVGVLDIDGLSVVSSGVYERHFIKDGVNYHHLLDPATGYPFDNGLVSVTIISKESVDGDGLSTTCFALGIEKGIELLDSLPDTYGIFITEDGTLHFSEGARDLMK